MAGRRAELGKQGRLLVIVGMLAGIFAFLGIMDRVQSGHSRGADRESAAVAQELHSAVERFDAALDAGTAVFSQHDPRADELLEPAGSFVINPATGQLIANRLIVSGGSRRCVTVQYDRTTGAIATEVEDGLCPPLLS